MATEGDFGKSETIMASSTRMRAKMGKGFDGLGIEYRNTSEKDKRQAILLIF